MKETGRWEVIVVSKRPNGSYSENYLHSVEDDLEEAIDKLRKLFTDPNEMAEKVWIKKERE